MSLMTHSLQVSDEGRATLTAWSRSTAIRAGLVTRARIVLASADGHGTSEVSRRVGVSRPTVIQWRNRYAAEGLAGLEDAARSGRPVHVDEDAIVAATLSPPPESLGVTHWSTRLLSAHLDPVDALGKVLTRQHLPGVVDDLDVVVGFGPVVTYEQHAHLPPVEHGEPARNLAAT
jgi:hypothetical protein